ncbi:hypothetical protein FACS189413_03020 [Bacteroidia bacterium]|nr:hypothetical protein FACS189413_03020 [Bacteroidia bacterium]
MKAKIYSLITFCLIIAHSLSAGTITVSSTADSGAGSLRQAIESASPNDKIVIPSDYVISLNSEIAIAKHLTIDGQGATVQVAAPGVSAYRVFNIGLKTGSETIFEIALENLILKGGDLSSFITGLTENDNANLANNSGAVLWIAKRVALTLKNTTLSGGTAYSGALVFCADGIGVSWNVDNCRFENGVAKYQSAGIAFGKGASSTVFTNCIFRNNENLATGTSVMQITDPVTLRNCQFLNNHAHGSARGSAAVATSGSATGGQIIVDKCVFANNVSGDDPLLTGTDGGAGFLNQCADIRVLMTNNTFYNNKGWRGAAYFYGGRAIVINNTFAGNIGKRYGSAVSVGTNGVATVTFINNIFAYNYDSQGGDVNIGGQNIIDGANNLFGYFKDVDNLDTCGDHVAPVDSAIYINNTSLFKEYTTTSFGDLTDKTIPTWDAIKQIVPLAENSVALGAGTPIYDPDFEVELLIPLDDQLGATRDFYHPTIGSFENASGSAIKDFTMSQQKVIAQNPAAGQLILNNALNVHKVQLIDCSGRTLVNVRPQGTISLANVPAGFYVARFETAGGVIVEKLLVK